MINGIYAIRRSAHLLTNTTIRLPVVIQSLDLSNLDYCPVIWSSLVHQSKNSVNFSLLRTERQD